MSQTVFQNCASACKRNFTEPCIVHNVSCSADRMGLAYPLKVCSAGSMLPAEAGLLSEFLLGALEGTPSVECGGAAGPCQLLAAAKSTWTFKYSVPLSIMLTVHCDAMTDIADLGRSPVLH